MKPHPLRSIELFGARPEGGQRPPRGSHWSFDATMQPDGPKPPKTALDRRRQPVAEWSPCPPRKEYPAAKQQGSGVTGLQPQQSVKRFPVTVIDGETGKPTEVMTRLVTNTLTAFAYGKTTPLFRRCNRGHTILDLRDNKRKDKQFVFNELCRMLGASQGEAAYRTLCSV